MASASAKQSKFPCFCLGAGFNWEIERSGNSHCKSPSTSS
ncbi:hypothetical protein NC653_036405 [Populus alba x Populus x berolinensis]|uniref:Uncharacterized protein n=1 Tax=Populus alba x Populus x berolinensis TaxID=444605 RepID=A0AAD6PWE2_9ROSI|nr:hypothetical protein NC653_036405 [Populus alba x Populus x berolinensis]